MRDGGRCGECHARVSHQEQWLGGALCALRSLRSISKLDVKRKDFLASRQQRAAIASVQAAHEVLLCGPVFEAAAGWGPGEFTS